MRPGRIGESGRVWAVAASGLFCRQVVNLLSICMELAEHEIGVVQHAVKQVRDKSYPLKSFVKSPVGLQLLSDATTSIANRTANQQALSDLETLVSKLPAPVDVSKFPTVLWTNGKAGVPKSRDWQVVSSTKAQIIEKAAADFKDEPTAQRTMAIIANAQHAALLAIQEHVILKPIMAKVTEAIAYFASIWMPSQSGDKLSDKSGIAIEPVESSFAATLALVNSLPTMSSLGLAVFECPTAEANLQTVIEADLRLEWIYVVNPSLTTGSPVNTVLHSWSTQCHGCC